MGKIQVEIYYTDKLESIRVDQQKMEIPTAIKTKPVIAWFGPTGGRVNWRGLAAEIRAMDPNRDENATYNFLFNGPDDKKREFMTCVKNENLGEEAQQESKAKTEQDYLINAENFHQMGNESAAFLNYKIAAEEYDSPQAQYEVAVRYQNGIGVEKSEEKAVGWYYKAAENGFMAAQMEIAKRNECGIGIEKNDEEAVRWYEIAAKNGNLTAQIKMAEQRKNGVEEIKTEREASKWYERIAENENAEELYNVALRYENGNGVQPNVNIAFELYQQAAQKGNSRAQHALGVIYEDGVIAQLDMKKAIEWYEIAAKNGNADAECDLGYCYQFGKGVQRNLNKAIELYEKSASQGNMYAQCNLGVCYEKGIGVSAEKVKASAEYADEINLGKIYHMGKSEPAALILNRQALTAHTFITGSTGSGKSNTVYELLRQLDAGGVNFMVIEPAKGEYKNVFGDREDVHVFGTNPKITKLLHINPFRFPEEIHVLEHIDRLIEIFSVCWPMYAAMPAVLKNAMLQAYEVCGWNLETSENEYNKNLFPTFQDLLTELVDVIEHSAYDKEVKNNYRGSLETRVRSLANGLNGQIFSADEIPEKQLFDENTIVDLSRVGSLESKSLIMGILIMRLNEYRMTSCTEMNNPLKHVTVLEEAHNILRRTSMEQTEEGSNVAGKSVEMIANAIAEMRTYGEGFVIADQSPGAVDISAIRNTNTKIIMRLPDEQDRQLAGKAAALKDDQLDEIARLPKGVAVIYQNNWTEPVLCKINKFEGEEKRYQYKTCATDRKAEMMSAILLKNLLKKEKGEPLDLNLRQLQDLLLKVSMPSKTKIAALKALQKNGRCRQKDIQSVVYKLVCTPKVEEELTHTESIEEWRDEIAYFGSTELADLDEEMLNEVAELILLEQIKRYDWPKTYLEQWQEFRKKEMLV